MNAQPLVLVINDVPPMVRLIELELGFQGMRTEHVLVDENPVERAMELGPDAIVLGAVLPTPQQFDILGKLHDSVAAPVVFISGSGMDADTALALEMGAAEIVIKPFSPDDLELRLQSLLGRTASDERLLRRGPLTVDVLHRSVWHGERKVALGTSEWALFLALLGAERPLDAPELLTTVWGEDYAGERRFLDIWIHRLRNTLGDDPSNPQLVLGDAEGYRLIE